MAHLYDHFPFVTNDPRDVFMRRWHQEHGHEVKQAFAIGGSEGRRRLKDLERLFERKWDQAAAEYMRVQGGALGEQA